MTDPASTGSLHADILTLNARAIAKDQRGHGGKTGPSIADLIEALAAEVTRLQEQIAEAIKILNPSMPESGLLDACRQVKQAALSERDNAEKAEEQIAVLTNELKFNAQMLARQCDLARAAENERDSAVRQSQSAEREP